MIIFKEEKCHRPLPPPWNYTQGPKSPAPPVKLGTKILRLLTFMILVQDWRLQVSGPFVRKNYVFVRRASKIS